MPSPLLEAPRLILRPYGESDIPSLVRFAGAREVAATTLRIPHPYTDQNAREYLSGGISNRTGDSLRDHVAGKW